MISKKSAEIKKKVEAKIVLVKNILFDAQRKSLVQILKDLKVLAKIYGVNNLTHYFTSLMYKKTAGNILDYMPRDKYLKLITEYYRSSGQHTILQDKNIFSAYMNDRNFPVPVKLGEIRKGKLFIEDREVVLTNTTLIAKLEGLVEKGPALFIKQVDSEGGKGVFKISNNSDNSLIDIKMDCEYIIEQEVIQHKDLSAINPYCLNTLRVLTVNRNGKVEIPDCFFRMGTGKSSVDNASSGGIFIHYDIHKNQMRDVAYKLPESGGKSFFKHPTSGFVFKGGKLPLSEEVIKLVSEAARVFDDKEIIGWDVAFTPEGPILLEANDNPHIVVMQISCNGLKSNEIYRDIFKKYMT